jgi:hypothetical protein
MNTLNFMTGLSILMKYKDNPNGYNIGADHDEIYVWATDKPVSEVDLARLYDLTWFQSGIETDAEGNPIYDPNESWKAFV